MGKNLMGSPVCNHGSLLVEIEFTHPLKEGSSFVVQGTIEVNSRIVQLASGQLQDLDEAATKKDDEALFDVIKLIEVGKLGEAKKVADKISDIVSRSLALFEIVRCCAGEILYPVEGVTIEFSEETLNTGEQIAATIPYEQKKSEAFWLLAMGYAKVSLLDKAKKLFPLFPTITNEWCISQVLSRIVKNYLAANEWEKAKELAESIPDKKVQSKVRARISSWEDRR